MDRRVTLLVLFTILTLLLATPLTIAWAKPLYETTVTGDLGGGGLVYVTGKFSSIWSVPELGYKLNFPETMGIYSGWHDGDLWIRRIDPHGNDVQLDFIWSEDGVWYIFWGTGTLEGNLEEKTFTAHFTGTFELIRVEDDGTSSTVWSGTLDFTITDQKI